MNLLASKLFKTSNLIIATFAVCFICSKSYSADLKIGDPAPNFTAKTNEDKEFTLSSQKGHYTVLYFYPKAGTPGCTKQACAFRDNIQKIKDLGAEVYGISADSVQEQKDFHKKHSLAFTLLADPDNKIIDSFGAKMPLLKMSKRWTFVLDSDLVIRAIEKNVDPALDAQKVADIISELKKKK